MYKSTEESQSKVLTWYKLLFTINTVVSAKKLSHGLVLIRKERLNFYSKHYYSLCIILFKQTSLEHHNMLSHEIFNTFSTFSVVKNEYGEKWTGFYQIDNQNWNQGCRGGKEKHNLGETACLTIQQSSTDVFYISSVKLMYFT